MNENEIDFLKKQVKNLTAEVESLRLINEMTKLEGDWDKIKSSQTFKVYFLNALREIVGKRMPVNKVGVPLISDFDLIDAPISERCMAIQVAMAKGEGK